MDRITYPKILWGQVKKVLNRMNFTFNKRTTLCLLTDIGNECKYLHQDVVLGYSIDHTFLQKVNKLFITQQDVGPLLTQSWCTHQPKNLQTHICVFGFSHHNLHELISDGHFHQIMDFLIFGWSQHIFAKFQQSRVYTFDSFVQYFIKILNT